VPNLKKHPCKRGYPIGVLVGFDEKQATLWQVFSNVVKPYITIKLDENDKSALYNFHESIIDALRPVIKEGIRTVVVAAPIKTNYGATFLDHAKKHHSWLFQEAGPNSATFGEIVGSAKNLHQVSNILKTMEFHSILSKTTSQDADRIVDTLEKRLNDSTATVLYSLGEIEELITRWNGRGDLKPEYVVLTDKYLTHSKEKNRINRLLQISKNKKVKTRIVSGETKAGMRVSQFGGLICITEIGD
jgi:stalled ribosome rescue protein Dom34